MPARHRLIIIAAVLALIAGCSGGNEVDTYQAHLKNSRSYLQQGQYRAALIEARNAHQRDPKKIAPSMLMARIYLDIGDVSKTVEVLDTLDNGDAADHVLLKAQALNRADKHRSALAYLNRHSALASGDDAGAYQLELARAYLGLGQFAKARQTAESIGSGKQVDAAILLARTDAASGNLEAAQSDLSRLLRAHPDNTDALILAGTVAKQRHALEQAEDYLTAALGALPKTDIMLPPRATTLRLLSEVLTLEDRPSEALVYAKVLAQADPAAHEAQSQLQKARGLIAKGDLDQAKPILTELFDKYHSRSAGALLGVVNYLQGNLRRATDLLSTNLDPETASDQALSLLAQAQLQLHDIDNVIKLLGPEVANRKSDPRLLALLGLAKLAHGQHQAGVDDLRQSVKLQPDNSFARLALITWYNQIGKPDTALQEARLAYTFKPTEPQYQRALLQQLLRTGQLLDARQIANEIAANNPKQAASQLLAGITWYRLRDYDHAARLFAAATKLAPDNVSIQLWNAQLALARNQPQQGRTIYRAVLAHNPDQIVALKGLFTSYEAAGELQKGLDALWNLANDDSKTGNPRGVLAEYYLRHNDLDGAHKYIEPAVQKYPNNAYLREVAIAVHSAAARANVHNRQFDQAKSQLAKAINLAPDNIALQMQLAGVEIGAGDYPAVEQSIEQLRPDHPGAAYALTGDLAAAKKQWSKAGTAYRQSWQASPNPAIARATYGALSKTSKNEAAQFLDQWADKLPTDPQPLVIRGVQAQQAGDNQHAVDAYRAALKRDPHNAMALNNLAWLLHTTHRTDALDFARRAHEVAPDNPAILDTYGWILFQNGDKAEAVKMLKRASKLDPDSDEIRSHLQKASA